jgi:hypothetical protein
LSEPYRGAQVRMGTLLKSADFTNRTTDILGPGRKLNGTVYS